MKLYYNPQSRAAVAKWMLDESGASYDLVNIDLQKKQQKTPEFLQINPAGKLPALVDGETRIYESAAICLYIADKYPQAMLAPAISDPSRGRYLTLMVFASSQLEPSMGDFLLKIEHSPQRGWNDFEHSKDAIEYELGEGPFLLGEQFSAADVMIGSNFLWQRMWGGSTGRPRLEAYINRLAARPAAFKVPQT